ncbi:transmembrane protein fuseless [Haematobia irritans]|uniref:transmembrane protein fuseless n=1 Tax=Haematobia irritans TaxID=7368 RepID=UPI003F508A88
MMLTSDSTDHKSLTADTEPCLSSFQQKPQIMSTQIVPATLPPAPMSTTVNTKKKKRNSHDLLLEILDVLLSCFIVAPCVIAYWRGTWELLGVLLFPQNVPLSALCSFLIGGIGHLVFTLTQRYFIDNIHPDKHRLTYYVVSRCYTFVFGIVCVNMWRGAWVLCDWLTSATSLIIICIVTSVAILFLIATRTLRNLGAAPYSVIMDHKSDYFDVETMFKIPGFHQPGLYLMDTLFSIFVIGTLVVIAWRGLWGIMDLTLYPEEKAKSAWSSLIMGYVTVAFTFILHPIVRWICKRINGFFKLVFCDIYYFAEFFGAVNAWRGIWNLLDVYVYPDNLILSYWLTHVIPFLILAAFKCSNSILVRGVFIDADGEGGESVDIPIHYVRLHFERERNKRTAMVYNQKPPNLIIKSNLDKDAQRVLIDKPAKEEITIQPNMDATQLV